MSQSKHCLAKCTLLLRSFLRNRFCVKRFSEEKRLIQVFFVSWIRNRQLFTYQNVEHELAKILNLLSCFKKANSTLEKQKQYNQAQDLWKIVKNNQFLYEKKVNELKLKVAKSKTVLNTSKTQIVIFELRNKIITKRLNICISGKKIKPSSQVQYFGVIVQDDQHWNMYLTRIH